MKTIKYKLTCETGFVGATHTEEREMEFDDDVTDERIDEELDHDAKEWALERIEYWHERIDPS